ncbi:MAG: polysaccharide pyruvyl transferase family protein [Kiritimatiellae bacterium]|nr:polysaccharide pyruvyl transferase family protein [Kiritimatiellia bacterium]
MRIAILTFHRAYNCGAMLQAWALKTVLERMGHVVEFPICNHVGETRRWLYDWVNKEKHGIQLIRSLLGRTFVNGMSIPAEDILRWRYRRFRKANFNERICFPEDLGKHYDLVVVGSDQVWSERHSDGDAPVFFAENILGDVRKIVYAASYGDKPLDDALVSRVVAAVERFSAVSVREPMAKQQLGQYTRKQIDTTLDPTLLLDGKDYEAIATSPRFVRKPYLFMYTLSTAPFFVNTAKTLSDRLGVRCIITPCYQYTRYAAPKGLTYSISPDRLVGLAREAKYVLAGSFHGTVMGVIFKKPFLSLRACCDNYESRPAALLNVMGCSNRLVNPETSIDAMEALLRTNLPSTAYDKLYAKRTESLEWLRRAIG